MLGAMGARIVWVLPTLLQTIGRNKIEPFDETPSSSEERSYRDDNKKSPWGRTFPYSNLLGDRLAPTRTADDDSELLDQNSASWNPLASWLRQIDELQRAA
jgi:hypothetical protein